jgi:hypothetical protein
MHLITWDTINHLMGLDLEIKEMFESSLLRKFLLAGKVDIAQNIMKPHIDDPLYQVNKLMYEAMIAQDIKDLPANFNKLSVMKISPKFGSITPLHTAALNPNLEILKKLLNMVVNDKNAKNVGDIEQNKPIHYAAACHSTGPLELLIARGADIYTTNTKKETPLIIAVKCNRPANIMILIEEDEEIVHHKIVGGN